MDTVPAPTFQLSLLGQFKLTGPDGTVELTSKKLMALLAYLACAAPQPHTREKLMTLLWGSHFEAQARQNLRQALTRIRRVLGDDALISNGESVALRPGVIACDVTQFEALLQGGSQDALSRAVDLYKGRLLPEIAISEEAWTEWVDVQRQRLEGLALDAMVELGEREFENGSYEPALDAANLAIAISNVREDAHRLVMRALAASGRRADALKHYELALAVLKRELSIEPDAATVSLAVELRKSSAARAASDVTANADQLEPSHPGRAAQAPSVRLGIPDRPSIAVLPFVNMGGHPEQEYLADGIVEDIITALSRFHWLLVIARNSSFTYKGRTVDVRQVARELGVRYVLEGSIRSSGNRLRITGQLIDAESGGHLWADKYDGELQDVFDLQDRVTQSVASAIEPRVLAAELTRATRKSTSKLDAYDCCLRARPHVLKLTRPDLDEAIRFLQSATQLDPNYGQAWAMLALCTANRYFLGHLDFEVVASDALRYARRAVECDRDHPEVLAAAAYMLAWAGEADESGALADRAVQLNPYSTYVCRYAGWTCVFNGMFEKAISLFRTTLVLDPILNDVSVFVGIAAANFYMKRYEEAIAWARRANSRNPEVTSSFRYLAASLAHAGLVAEAKTVIQALLERQPNSSLARSRAGSSVRFGWMIDHYIEGLRIAGLPER